MGHDGTMEYLQTLEETPPPAPSADPGDLVLAWTLTLGLQLSLPGYQLCFQQAGKSPLRLEYVTRFDIDLSFSFFIKSIINGLLRK